MSQEKVAAKEKNPKNRVVRISVFLRPHRSAMAPAITEPMNMPTNDSEVTYATWSTVTPHRPMSLGAVVAKLLMSANSKK